MVLVLNLQVLNRENTQYQRDKGRPTTTTERNVPSSFPRRQEEKQEKLHNLREDKGKQTDQKQTKATKATEAANKANQTKLNDGIKQRR